MERRRCHWVRSGFQMELQTCPSSPKPEGQHRGLVSSFPLAHPTVSGLLLCGQESQPALVLSATLSFITGQPEEVSEGHLQLVCVFLCLRAQLSGVELSKKISYAKNMRSNTFVVCVYMNYPSWSKNAVKLFKKYFD